ncbi:histone acetylation protein-domain-containing protein [Infundibulicybe gibba]|nr:histone acetylation protein-domain-containing protein [Infundibulicybe gibba]
MTNNLRDFLLAGLTSLPGTRKFHIHVLETASRKNTSLFPFASPRPRVQLQDILILLSEQATADSPRVLVTGVEVCLYQVPATSCGILYVSKVDSTGHSMGPSPTAALVRALLRYYADPMTRPVEVEHLWIQLFARAQGQYLFPNSAEYAGKRPLSDVKLCGWWRGIMSDVAGTLDSQTKLKLYYILPGCSELEAMNTLKAVPVTAGWIYGHPYSQTEIPLPCPPKNGLLGHIIPSFDDDPKSRFIDEIAYTTEGDGVKAPKPKRPRRSSSGEPATVANGVETAGELKTVSADEFWERMSFRQECVAGAVTGFFSLIASAPLRDPPPPPPPAGQISSQVNKRIMTSLQTGVEFSTRDRAIRATETIESAIRGLCRPLPSDDLVASADVYDSYIYASISVANLPLTPKLTPTDSTVQAPAPPVTVLTARKKKKRDN